MVTIAYKDEALKQLKCIGPNERKKAKRKIIALADDPLIGKPLQGTFMGKRSLKVWPLQIIYTFNTETQTITIKTVDYRGSVYK